MTNTQKRLLVVAVFAALVIVISQQPIGVWINEIVEWGRQRPVAVALAYVAFVAIGTVFFLPGSIAMMVAGLVFGFLPGFFFALLAIPIGAQCAFEFGRWAVRPWVRRKISENPRLLAIDAAIREQAFLIVLLTRLSLVIPFNALNYAYGAAPLKSTTHFTATAIGMLPAIALFVYLGTLARDLGQIFRGEAAPPELGYWLLGIGLIVLLAVTRVIHISAKKVLEKHLVNQESNG